MLRLFEWTKDFKALTQRHTHTQVWIQLWESLQEYWMERTLYKIAGAIEKSLLNDNVTNNRLFGHYARVLVDLDLSWDIFLWNYGGTRRFCLPQWRFNTRAEFCTHCKSIGHNITSYWWLHPKKADKQEKPIPVKKGKKPINSQKQYTQGRKPTDNSEGIGSSKAFEVAVPCNSRRHTQIRSFRLQTYRKRASRNIVLNMSSQQRICRLWVFHFILQII